jgi:hypothetical protein
LGDANVTVRDEVLKRVASNIGPSLVKYKHGSQVIVTSPEDQLLLQQTGVMNGRQMLMFNRIHVGLTGISIHSTSTTLAACRFARQANAGLHHKYGQIARQQNNATKTHLPSCTMDSSYKITSFQTF